MCGPENTSGRLQLAVLVCITAAGISCSQLKFLKSPSVPKPRGDSLTVQGPAFGVAPSSAPDPTADWSTYNRTFTGDRYAPFDGITTANVDGLRPECSYKLDQKVTFQTGPLEIGGTIFFTTAASTYAIDASSCALRWKHDYEYQPKPDFDLGVNRGLAYLDGKLFRGSNDGRVYALDAATGRELWNVVAGNVKKGETFPAAPIAWNGLVFIGNAGGDNFGVVGRMMAFDVNTGGRVWSVDLVARNDSAAGSWPPSTEIIPRAGGATWTSYTLDTLSGTLYVPTGNAAPDFLSAARPGDNLHTTSIVEIDSRLGTITGWHQLVERDIHDWDVSAAPVLITTKEGRKLIVAGGKDGHVNGIERKSGKRLYRTAVTRIENVDTPLTEDGTRFCPGVNGGVEWNGPTYLPVTNAVYVNAIEWCTTIKVGPVAKLEGKDGLPWTGSSELKHPFGVQDSAWAGYLTALDADDGSVRWQFKAPTPLVAGVTATKGGLIFTADLKGTVYGFDARNGAILYRYEAGQPVGGGVISYEAGGRQFVAVAAGMHAPGTWKLESEPARLLVFALSR